MAAHRITRVTNNSHVLPRCKSEGTLIDFSEELSSSRLTDVKGVIKVALHYHVYMLYFLSCFEVK